MSVTNTNQHNSRRNSNYSELFEADSAKQQLPYLPVRNNRKQHNSRNNSNSEHYELNSTRQQPPYLSVRNTNQHNSRSNSNYSERFEVDNTTQPPYFSVRNNRNQHNSRNNSNSERFEADSTTQQSIYLSVRNSKNQHNFRNNSNYKENKTNFLNNTNCNCSDMQVSSESRRFGVDSNRHTNNNTDARISDSQKKRGGSSQVRISVDHSRNGHVQTLSNHNSGGKSTLNSGVRNITQNGSHLHHNPSSRQKNSSSTSRHNGSSHIQNGSSRIQNGSSYIQNGSSESAHNKGILRNITSNFEHQNGQLETRKPNIHKGLSRINESRNVLSTTGFRNSTSTLTPKKEERGFFHLDEILKPNSRVPSQQVFRNTPEGRIVTPMSYKGWLKGQLFSIGGILDAWKKNRHNNWCF